MRSAGKRFGKMLWGRCATTFDRDKFTEGVVHGISTAGRLLAEHFPASVARHDDAC